jgi:hypothetical protein
LRNAAKSEGNPVVLLVGQSGIEQMLTDDLAKAIANPIAIATVSVHGLRRDLPGFVFRFAFGLGGP